MLKILLLASMLATTFCSSHSKAELKVGDALPTLTGTNHENKMVETKNFNKDYVLVYFYPKADTPGCTKQACSLRDSYAILTKKGVKIFGVSTDDVKAQKAFKEKYKLPFDLIADTDKAWANAFHVSVTMGFASRQAFLFKDGKLVWLDTSASTAEQAQDVLAFLK